jgi:hypothetical protein
MSHKLLVAMTIWVTASVLISLFAGVEVLVTLILIGLLIARELSDDVLERELKHRVDFFIYACILLFAVVVINRIWLVLS